MSAKILDGKILASQLKGSLKSEILKLKETTGGVPRLVNIMAGEDPGALAYANSQKKSAEQVGLQYELRTVPKNISQKELISLIAQLNRDPKVHGIMVYKPVPAQINFREVIRTIDANKDLEGINPKNLGRMFLGESAIIPCTPAAVMELVHSSGIDSRGKEAVLLGRSEIVGKPLQILFLKQNATVTVCHSATSEAGRLVEHIGRADILVAALGKPRMVKGEWIKKGAVVIDVGINQVEGKITGDVDFDSAAEQASFITPVPGGVGPVTVVMLMKNGVEAYKLQKGIEG